MFLLLICKIDTFLTCCFQKFPVYYLWSQSYSLVSVFRNICFFFHFNSNFSLLLLRLPNLWLLANLFKFIRDFSQLMISFTSCLEHVDFVFKILNFFYHCLRIVHHFLNVSNLAKFDIYLTILWNPFLVCQYLHIWRKCVRYVHELWLHGSNLLDCNISAPFVTFTEFGKSNSHVFRGIIILINAVW